MEAALEPEFNPTITSRHREEHVHTVQLYYIYGIDSLALWITCAPKDSGKVSSQLLFIPLIVIYVFIPLFHFLTFHLVLTASLLHLLLSLLVAI